MTQSTFTGNDLIQDTIQRIKDYEPDEGYHIAFSGGKDSICIYWLSKMAGVKFHAEYSMTTIDPRTIPQFIRLNYPDVSFRKPTYKGVRTNFYKLVEKKGLPSRQVRWCCDILKETGGGKKGDTVMIGVRRSESNKRSKRELYYDWKGKHMFLPIYDWKDNDVWDFIRSYNLPYPSLYDEGHKRLGCVLCPLACKKARMRDYEEYPERVRAIEIALAKFMKYKPESSLSQWGDNPHDIIHHWVDNSPLQSAKGTCLSDYIDDGDSVIK